MEQQEDDLYALLACTTPEKVLAMLAEEVDRLGLKNVAWGAALPIPVSGSRFVLFNNYSDEWKERYVEQGYVTKDPTVSHGLKSVLPVLWSNPDIQNAAPEFWEDARAYGLKEGIAQSVFDRRGVCSMLSVSRDAVKFTRSELIDKMPKISWLSQLSHAVMSNLILPNEMPETEAKLSEKEKATLRLSASGKTSQEIGDELKLSKRTVDWHLESAQTKLKASNRTDAAVKAIVLDLID